MSSILGHLTEYLENFYLELAYYVQMVGFEGMGVFHFNSADSEE